MSSNVKKTYFSTQRLTRIALLSAIGLVLQRLDMPLPFLPPWLKIDFAEIPVLVGAFAMGPMAGILIELVKNLVSLLFSTTAGVGELANFIMGIAFVVPASMIYRQHRTKKRAVIGLGVGTLALTVVGVLLNYYLLMPFYIEIMFKGSTEALINIAFSINENMNSLWMICVWGVVPFNLIKGAVLSMVMILLYKPFCGLFVEKRQH